MRTDSIIAIPLALSLLWFSSCSKVDLSQPVNTSTTTQSVFAEYSAVVSQIEGRMLSIQNNDGGWDWMDTPENLASSTNTPTAYANMFGVNAMGVLDGYSVTSNSAAIAAIQKTVDTLMAKPLSRTERIYPNDCELLIRAGQLTGNNAYLEHGAQGQVYEKEYLAAVHILGTTSPTAAQVNAITQEQISEVSEAQLVSANRDRMIAGGRNASIRAYDWSSRMRVAALRGDTAYQRAMANTVVTDFTEISSVGTPELLGLAASISDLAPLSSEPEFASVINQGRALLLARQQSDGLFGGNIQDHAFIARALYDLHENFALARLLIALKKQVSSQGYIVDTNGKELPEAESELLSALSVVVKM